MQELNIKCISVTLLVLKLLKSKLSSFIDSNISDISVTLLVSNALKSKPVSFGHTLNMLDILVTLLVSTCSKLILVKFLHSEKRPLESSGKTKPSSKSILVTMLSLF